LTELLSVNAARRSIIAHFSPVAVSTVPLTQALNRIIASDIASSTDLPPFDNSSMDGYAVYSADTLLASQASPVSLPVVLDIPAGRPDILPIQPGQAARIMTGAPLPLGANAVVPVENTDQYRSHSASPLPASVKIFSPAKPGDYLRPRGMDLKAGQTVLPQGHKLRPVDLGLLASLGLANLAVYQHPKVALLSTGDELLEPDQPLAPGKIHDSNAYMLAGLIEQIGCEVIRLGISRDDPEDLTTRLNRALDLKADLIISSAGVSVGTYDFVKGVIEQHGQIDFWRVNMRPGKPLAFGNYRGVPIIGLPGNPASAFVGFMVFAAPVLRRLAGYAKVEHTSLRAILDQGIESDGRETYIRGFIERRGDRFFARLAGHQGSGNLYALTLSNALLIVPSEVKSLSPGDELDAWTLTSE
jgi:molybdopterin molybdotransferase